MARTPAQSTDWTAKQCACTPLHALHGPTYATLPAPGLLITRRAARPLRLPRISVCTFCDLSRFYKGPRPATPAMRALCEMPGLSPVLAIACRFFYLHAFAFRRLRRTHGPLINSCLRLSPQAAHGGGGGGGVRDSEPPGAAPYLLARSSANARVRAQAPAPSPSQSVFVCSLFVITSAPGTRKCLATPSLYPRGTNHVRGCDVHSISARPVPTTSPHAHTPRMVPLVRPEFPLLPGLAQEAEADPATTRVTQHRL